MIPHQRPYACEPILHLIRPGYIGVEIGLFVGDSSEEFMKRTAFMFLVDPFEPYESYPDKGILFNHDKMVRNITDRMDAIARDRYEFLPLYSKDAAELIPDVDFVFIDGNHTLQAVYEDITLYWPKVKRGGFISGHDYNPSHHDVMQAVQLFATDVLTIEVYADCWVIKKL